MQPTKLKATWTLDTTPLTAPILPPNTVEKLLEDLRRDEQKLHEDLMRAKEARRTRQEAQ